MDITIKDHDEARQGEALLLAAKPGGGSGSSRKLYIESYGCAMNFSDSEIVASIMADNGFGTVATYQEADVIFINTCSIRENAEQRVRNRLREFRAAKQHKPHLIIGVLGCMAERLKAKFLEEEQLIDLVIGPDAYRDLPNLVAQADGGQQAINVLLSRDETYADISPVRLGSNGVSAYVSITRGCDNMCSFCVVPFTRGRERSRDPKSIENEVRDLIQRGYKEVILLGQNVDSYKWKSEAAQVDFADLLERVALISPNIRVRFSTSHPKDFSDKVLHTMARHQNICKCIHLPVQSGNSRILELMNRTYDRPWYMDRIAAIRRILPACQVTTDIITGFCSETEEEHRDTLSLLEEVSFSLAYMFSYSERPGTLAAKRYADDVSEADKSRRLTEIIALQRSHSGLRAEAEIGQIRSVLIDGYSKRSDQDFAGRTDHNFITVFPVKEGVKIGDYVDVLIERCTTATLIGRMVE